MKRKIMKKYFNIENLEDIKVSNLEDYVFNIETFKNKRQSLIKKSNLSADVLNMVFFDMSNKYHVNIGELLTLYKGNPKWEEALMFLLNENILNSFATKTNIISNSIYEKELDIMLNNSNEKTLEKFHETFSLLTKREKKEYVSYNKMIKFFSKDETLLLMLLDAYIIEENNDYIIVKFGDYKVSNKKLSFKKETLIRDNTTFPFIYKSIFLKDTFNEKNIILPNGERYSKENFNKIKKED